MEIIHRLLEHTGGRMMTKSKAEQISATKNPLWEFRISNITPFFQEIRNGTFKKVRDDDTLYTCAEEHNKIAQDYIDNGLLELYIPDVPLRTSDRRYVIEDGHFMIYESKKKIENGKEVWQEYGRPITDNFYIVIDTNIEFDDGVEKIHKYRGRIIVDNGANEFKFDADSRLFANPQDMAKLLSNVGGAKVIFDNNNLKDIRIATQWTSEYESRKISQVFGWQTNKVYRAQSSMIIRGGVVKLGDGDSEVDLSDIDKACKLDILPITDKEFKAVGKHIVDDLVNVHARYPIDCLFGFTFLAPIASQIVESKKWSGGRIGVWLVGSSQCGKSHTALLFQNFFGGFTGEGSVFGWGGTPYSIQAGGYYFKDAIFMVDDFKVATFSSSGLSTVISILQNYTDGASRTRLDTNMNGSSGKSIKGSLLITGEDLLDDVGSVMNRYHVVRMDDSGMNTPAFSTTKDYVEFYSGFMGRYIAWLLEDNKSVEKLVIRIEKWKVEFMDRYEGTNINRIAQSFAYNLGGFDMFCRFLAKNGFISKEKQTKMVKIHKNNLFLNIDPHIEAAKDATVGEVFMSTLRDLIASGSVKIHVTEKDKPAGYGIRDEYIGFDNSDKYIYFFGKPTLSAVIKMVGVEGRLKNSKTNLVNELVKTGVMVPHIRKDGTKGSNTFNKGFYGNVVATWRILKSALGYEDFASEEDEDVEDEEW